MSSPLSHYDRLRLLTKKKNGTQTYEFFFENSPEEETPANSQIEKQEQGAEFHNESPAHKLKEFLKSEFQLIPVEDHENLTSPENRQDVVTKHFYLRNKSASKSSSSEKSESDEDASELLPDHKHPSQEDLILLQSDPSSMVQNNNTICENPGPVPHALVEQQPHKTLFEQQQNHQHVRLSRLLNSKKHARPSRESISDNEEEEEGSDQTDEPEEAPPLYKRRILLTLHRFFAGLFRKKSSSERSANLSQLSRWERFLCWLEDGLCDSAKDYFFELLIFNLLFLLVNSHRLPRKYLSWLVDK